MSLTAQDFPTVTLHPSPSVESGHVLASVPLPRLATGEATFGERLHASLHRDERTLALAMSPYTQATFAAGRVALRAAVHAQAPQLAVAPIMRTARGAPALPAGIAGSVSHTRRVALALARVTSDPNITVGVDIEELPQEDDVRRPDIGRRILTTAEREHLVHLEPLSYRRATVVRFALKEAVYKAIDPMVQRYVGFTEVELDVADSGSATVTLLLPELRAQQVHVRAAWWILDEHIIATAMSERS